MVQTRIYSLGIIFVVCFGYVFSTCTYPWGAGNWADTLGRTSITFSTSNMDGYDLNYIGSSVSTWTCLFQNGSLFLSRSSSLNVAGDDYYLYACMLVNTVSSTKVYYHLMSNVDNLITKSGNAQRITARLNSVSVTDICTICAENPASISLTVTEYTVMANDGTTTAQGTISSPEFAVNPCDPTTTTQATTTTSTTTQATTTTSTTTQATTTTSTTTQETTTTSTTTQETIQKPVNTSSTSSAEASTNAALIAGVTVGCIAALTGIFVTTGVIYKKNLLCFKSKAVSSS